MRRILTAVLIVVIVAALLGAGIVGVVCLNKNTETTRDAYAVYWVAEMVIGHLDANNGKWPTGWDELHDDYQRCFNSVGGIPWRFEELSTRVGIDWAVNPSELKALANGNGKSQVRVIWLTDGRQAYWEGQEPNRMILDYLAGRRKPLST